MLKGITGALLGILVSLPAVLLAGQASVPMRFLYPSLRANLCDERASCDHEHFQVNGGLFAVVEDCGVEDDLAARSHLVEPSIPARLDVGAIHSQTRRF